MKNRKPWMYLAVSALVALPFLWPLAREAWAAADAWFLGRAFRMTRTDPAISNCVSSAYSCAQFDTNKRFRYWNGTTYEFVVIAPSPVGAVKNQVLTTRVSDGGVATLYWRSPTDAGLVP